MAAVLAVAGDLCAATLTLHPSHDNSLYEDETGALSNGAGQHLFSGRTSAGRLRRALLRFNIAEALPQDAVIERVDLRLHMSRTITAGEPHTLHRVLASWGEGASDAPGAEGAGDFASASDATWVHTHYDERRWNLPGGDFIDSPSALQIIVGRGSYTWSSTPELLADVQGWLRDPGANFGWILLGNEYAQGTAKRFDSREHPDPDVRPRLTIAYRLVPEPALAPLLLIGAALWRRFSPRLGWACRMRMIERR